jgi:Mn2+/Fe2+ NRAMP family transporter
MASDQSKMRGRSGLTSWASTPDALEWSGTERAIPVPPLLFMMMLITDDRRMMGDSVNNSLAKLFGWRRVGIMA